MYHIVDVRYLPGHQLTPVPEDGTCSAAEADRHGNRCQGNGVAIAISGGDGVVTRGRSMTQPRPPPVAKRSCLRQTSDSRVTLSDLELPRSPRRANLQRLPARLRVTDSASPLPATDSGNNNSSSQNGNDDNDDDIAATTNYDHHCIDSELLNAADFPLGVRLTTV